MNIPNFRAYVDNKIYSVVGWNGSFIILSRKFESKYVQSINVKRKDVIIMQGSGIEDRKGNEIFNGDIVINSDKDIGIVRFKDGAFEVDFKEYIPALLGLINDDLEIIGNVYKNKKLLDKVIDKNKTNKKLPKTNISSNSILVPTLLGIASIIIKKKKYK